MTDNWWKTRASNDSWMSKRVETTIKTGRTLDNDQRRRPDNNYWNPTIASQYAYIYLVFQKYRRSWRCWSFRLACSKASDMSLRILQRLAHLSCTSLTQYRHVTKIAPCQEKPTCWDGGGTFPCAASLLVFVTYGVDSKNYNKMLDTEFGNASSMNHPKNNSEITIRLLLFLIGNCCWVVFVCLSRVWPLCCLGAICAEMIVSKQESLEASKTLRSRFDK